MSQVEEKKRSPLYIKHMLSEQYKNKYITTKSKYAYEENFNPENYVVLDEDEIKDKAIVSIENYAEECWDNIKDYMKDNHHGFLRNYVKFDIDEYVKEVINIDGIEQHAGLEDYDEVNFEDDNYYVIPKKDIPWE